MADERVWYPLDATWHTSANVRMSALHLGVGENCEAACDKRKILLESDAYTETEAGNAGRTLCKRCLKINRSSTNTRQK